MGRAPRVWEEGAVYHVVPKGNDGRPIFLDDRDRVDFLVPLHEAAEARGAVIVGYCLMKNHVHWLIQSGEEGLSAFLRDVLGGHSRRWNRRHGHEGHTLKNRTFAVHVKTDAHFWCAARYIDMNPVAADAVRRPQDWPWSSYRAHAGLDVPPRFLDNAEFLTYFAPNPERARAKYLRFVSDWRPPKAPALDPILAARLLATAATEEDPDAPRARILLGLTPLFGATAARGQDSPGAAVRTGAPVASPR